MPSVFERIPRTAFDANVALGAAPRMSIGRNTELVRDIDGEVRLRYRHQSIVRYRRTGSLVVGPGDASPAVVERLRCVVPPPWRVTRVSARRAYPDRVRLTFGNGGYHMDMSARNTGYEATFLSNGNFVEGDYEIPFTTLCQYEAESEGYEPPVWTAPNPLPAWVRVDRGHPRYLLVDADAPPPAPPRRHRRDATLLLGPDTELTLPPTSESLLAAWRLMCETTELRDVQLNVSIDTSSAQPVITGISNLVFEDD